MRVADYINVHKILVIPVVFGMMCYYDNFSTEAFVYFAMHGTYSLLWLLKGRLFPDKKFEQTQPLWIGILFIFLPLAGYYIAPYLLISRHLVLPPYLVGAAVALFTTGIFLHYVSDAQKHYTLTCRKGLITTGLFARTRNPNYLGEILIYLAYAMMAMHPLPFAVLGGWVFGFFIPNMRKKDRSLSRYKGFEAYRKHTGLLLPKLW